MCRDEVRKAKALLELNWTGDAKKNNKGFYGYDSQKRKIKKNQTYLLMSKSGKTLTPDKEKAEVLDNLFQLLSTWPQSIDCKMGTGEAKYLLL